MIFYFFLYYIAVDYFFILFLLTIPISFYNTIVVDYISFSIKRLKFFLLTIVFFYFVLTFFYYNILYNLLDPHVYFLHVISCLFFIIVNIARFRLIKDPVNINQFIQLDLKSSIIFLIILLLLLGFQMFLLYIFFINSILQLIIYRNYIFPDIKKYFIYN